MVPTAGSEFPTRQMTRVGRPPKARIGTANLLYEALSDYAQIVVQVGDKEEMPERWDRRSPRSARKCPERVPSLSNFKRILSSNQFKSCSRIKPT